MLQMEFWKLFLLSHTVDEDLAIKCLSQGSAISGPHPMERLFCPQSYLYKALERAEQSLDLLY